MIEKDKPQSEAVKKIEKDKPQSGAVKKIAVELPEWVVESLAGRRPSVAATDVVSSACKEALLPEVTVEPYGHEVGNSSFVVRVGGTTWASAIYERDAQAVANAIRERGEAR